MKKSCLLLLFLILTLSCTTPQVKNPDGTWNTEDKYLLEVALKDTSKETKGKIHSLPETDKQLFFEFQSFMTTDEKEIYINELSTEERKLFIGKLQENMREEGFKKILFPMSSYSPQGKEIAKYHEKDLKTLVSNFAVSQIPIDKVGIIRSYIDNNDLYVQLSFKVPVVYNTIQTTRDSRVLKSLDRYGFKILRLSHKILEKMGKDKHHIKGGALKFTNIARNFVSKTGLQSEEVWIFSKAEDIASFARMEITDREFIDKSIIIINNTRVQIGF
jgi:hypothetical protein